MVAVASRKSIVPSTEIQKMAAAKKESKQLSREDWLAAALEVLYGEGIGKVSIVRIARDLGVTSGSFYWHFKDRNDLLRSLLSFWVRSQTAAIFEKVEQFEGTPSERLFKLMEILTLGEQARYEVAVRAWAGFDDMAAEVVRGTDKRRIEWLRSIFRELGFRGNEVEMRARLFVYYQLAEPSILWREPKSKRREIIKLRHRLLMSRVAT
jgi:AcrR family transcriptional regulator